MTATTRHYGMLSEEGNFGMFSEEGNFLVANALDTFAKGVDKLVAGFREDIKDVSNFGHIEVNDTAVREAIYADLVKVLDGLAEEIAVSL